MLYFYHCATVRSLKMDGQRVRLSKSSPALSRKIEYPDQSTWVSDLLCNYFPIVKRVGSGSRNYSIKFMQPLVLLRFHD
jgi:hypothetical protein